MSRYCFQATCVSRGKATDRVVCPTCGDKTRPDFTNLPPPPAALDPSREFGIIETNSRTPGESAATLDDVVIYTAVKSDDGQAREKLIGRIYGYALPLVEATACIVLAISGRFTITFALGALFSVQQVIVNYRGRKLTGPISEDPEIQARISQTLKELCIAAGCPIPRVTLRRTATPAGVLLGRGRAVLLLSPDLARVTDDDALRAVIAHEVAHLSSSDIAVARRRITDRKLGIYLLMLALFFTIGKQRYEFLLILIVLLIPFLKIVALSFGFNNRWRETRADLAGVALTEKPDAMIRSLELVSEIVKGNRERIYGRALLKWALTPFSIPATTHPPLEERIARLRAFTPTSEAS
jgi:heat shock protein HtpX